MARPRSVSPEPEELEKLGVEMVEWVKQNKPTHLSEWFSIEKGILWKQWDTMCQREEFIPHYEIALSIVAKNARDGTLDKSIAQRFLSLYHRDLKREEREEKEFEAKLKTDELSKVEAQHTAKADAILNQLSELQSKIADSK